MREKKTSLPFSRGPVNKFGRNDGNRKSYLANTTVTTDADKNHQWRLKLVGKSMVRNRTSA